MSDKATKIIAFIALGAMAIFTVALVLSFLNIGGEVWQWATWGTVIGSGVVGIGLFIFLKIKMRRNKQEREEHQEKKRKEREPFDELIEPNEK